METTIQVEDAHYNPSQMEAPSRGDVILYRDSMVVFLRLKVTYKMRAWQFDATFEGKHVKRKIGNASIIPLADARVRAYEWARLLQEGKEPPSLMERKRRTEQRNITVGELFIRYDETHLQESARTRNEIERGFRAYWDTVRDMRVCDLTSEFIKTWISDLARTKGKPTATKQFTALRACLNYGRIHKLCKLPEGCLDGVKGYPSARSLNYLKPGDEVARLTAALAKETADVSHAIWLLLWTCQRKSNVLSMRWDEIDWVNKVWLISPDKTKTNKQYMIALTPKALEILNLRKEYADCDDEYVFPCVRDAKTRHFKYLNKAWLRVRARAALGKLRLHDLRHTGATWLAMDNASAHVIKEALQHSSIATSEWYVHLIQAPQRVRDQMSKAQDAMTQ